MKSEAREAVILIGEIDSIEFKRGWVRGKAVIRPKSLKILDRFPSSADDSVRLYFKRKVCLLAESLISELNLQLALSRLDLQRSRSVAVVEPPGGR